jgi:hypothetical protein
MYGFKFYKTSPPIEIRNGDVVLRIEKMNTGAGNQNYFMKVRLANTGPKDIVFDSAELRLEDHKKNLSFFSISKDKTNVSLPPQLSDVITSATVPTQSGISGQLWFVTGPKDADAEMLTLRWGSASTDLKED